MNSNYSFRFRKASLKLDDKALLGVADDEEHDNENDAHEDDDEQNDEEEDAGDTEHEVSSHS